MASILGKFCAPSQELESERPPDPPDRSSAVGPRDSAAASERRACNGRASGELGTLDMRPMADANNAGKVARYYGPPTDPALDAHRDNDHRTRWERLSTGDRWLIVALIVVVIGGFALVTLG